MFFNNWAKQGGVAIWVIFGLTKFSHFGTQIGQQNFFIIWQDGQTPHQLFFTNVSQNRPTGNQSIWGPKSKKNTYCTMPKRQYHREKLPSCFLTIGPKKGEFIFGYW